MDRLENPARGPCAVELLDLLIFDTWLLKHQSVGRRSASCSNPFGFEQRDIDPRCGERVRAGTPCQAASHNRDVRRKRAALPGIRGLA